MQARGLLAAQQEGVFLASRTGRLALPFLLSIVGTRVVIDVRWIYRLAAKLLPDANGYSRCGLRWTPVHGAPELCTASLGSIPSVRGPDAPEWR